MPFSSLGSKRMYHKLKQVINVVIVGDPEERYWTGVCSCGGVTDKKETEQEARNAHDIHKALVSVAKVKSTLLFRRD